MATCVYGCTISQTANWTNVQTVWVASNDGNSKAYVCELCQEREFAAAHGDCWVGGPTQMSARDWRCLSSRFYETPKPAVEKYWPY